VIVSRTSLRAVLTLSQAFDIEKWWIQVRSATERPNPMIGQMAASPAPAALVSSCTSNLNLRLKNEK
jgi:hypothetical protein